MNTNEFLRSDPLLFEYFGVVLVLLFFFGITFFFKRIPWLRTVAGLGLIAAPVAYFYLILDAHTVNIPYTDDWNLLETVYKLQRESDFVKAAKILFEQVNQHRFAFERLVMLAMVALSGTVNIKGLLLLGNLFLLAIAYLFFLTCRQERVTWHYFIPVPYVLFNLAYFENAFWGIAAIQNTPLIFFAFLSAYGLGRRDTVGLALGIGAALVATFVSGTGMVAWVVGAIILGFQQRYRTLIPWIGLAVGIILFYFLFDYYFIESAEGKVWQHPIFNGLLWFGFLGNALYLDIPHPLYPAFYPDMVACIFLGIFLGLVFVAWVLRYYFKPRVQWSHWFVLGAFLFVLGTGAMFVLSRPMSQFFMYGGNVFSRRYMLFGVVLLATAYIGLVVLTKRVQYLQQGVLVLGLLGFVALNFQSYHTSLIQLRKQYDELSLDAYYWKHYTTFLTASTDFGAIPFWNHPTRMKELVAAVETSGLSQFYASDYLPDPTHIKALMKDNAPKYDGNVEAEADFRQGDDNLPAEYLTFFIDPRTEPDPGCLLLVSEKYVLPLPALPPPNSWTDFLKERTYYGSRFYYGMYRSKLPSGVFGVWVVTPNDSDPGRLTFLDTGKRMRLRLPSLK
ncbi:hypothetical protein [Salmonirosea aquatica]|uniref:Glycosyltransferase RgtA/B/C/D-like domain-containing protein n=1 Tax=Salmonirosea aquatica TaxID=2654236 RepID=A0A7C9BL85_9BACT|nr:hypothetical protein [Cytophagaceae bacterium SJW1-29]